MTESRTGSPLLQKLQMIALARDIEMPTDDRDPDTRLIAAFQEWAGLPATGTADDVTMARASEEYACLRELSGPAQSCVIRFPAALSIYPGQSHPHVALAQAMFQSLSSAYPGFQTGAVSGTLDAASAQNLRYIQHCAGLEKTGVLDKQTWNRLCGLYRATFDRFHAPSQG